METFNNEENFNKNNNNDESFTKINSKNNKKGKKPYAPFLTSNAILLVNHHLIVSEIAGVSIQSEENKYMLDL